MFELEGSILEYSKGRICYYNKIRGEFNVVLVGGLMFSIMNLPYTKDLADYCETNKLGLYIPQFRSHPNYGIHNFEDDLEDLNSLLEILNGKIIAIGNSTGCQVIMKTICNVTNIILCILQGPVSDVEYEEHVDSNLKEHLMIAENSKGILPFKHCGNYITAERYSSLFKRFGTEDMFSSYLNDDFYESLNPKGIRCAFVISKKDEFVIKSNKEKLSKIKNSGYYELEDGDHFLTRHHDRQAFIKIINDEIKGMIQK